MQNGNKIFKEVSNDNSSIKMSESKNFSNISNQVDKKILKNSHKKI
jgi:hypothetical protein